jgi:ribonuclease HII
VTPRDQKPQAAAMPAPSKPEPDFSLETQLRARGLWPIAGVDEVGRGPLAGPVCAAAVILDPDNIPHGIRDSKAMTAKAREEVFERIGASARAIGFSFVTAREIDATDIRRAALRAMAQAVAALSVSPAYAIVDGRDTPPLPCPGEAIIKGDARSLSIAAASIVAKVSRDRMMRVLADEYPRYGFLTNMGYGSRSHLEALATFGPTPFHRMSFAPFKHE